MRLCIHVRFLITGHFLNYCQTELWPPLRMAQNTGCHPSCRTFLIDTLKILKVRADDGFCGQRFVLLLICIFRWLINICLHVYVDGWMLLPYCHSVLSPAVFCICFHGDCSSDLAVCMLPFLMWPPYSRLSFPLIPYTIHLSDARVNHHSQLFVTFPCNV